MQILVSNKLVRTGSRQYLLPINQPDAVQLMPRRNLPDDLVDPTVGPKSQGVLVARQRELHQCLAILAQRKATFAPQVMKFRKAVINPRRPAKPIHGFTPPPRPLRLDSLSVEPLPLCQLASPTAQAGAATRRERNPSG